MTDKEKKKKGYEPPIVKEVGGAFDQATGISNCTVGGAFAANCSAGGTFGLPCTTGGSPSGSGCTVGFSDQACATGTGDAGTCGMGTGG